jgi:hypothetical protein
LLEVLSGSSKLTKSENMSCNVLAVPIPRDGQMVLLRVQSTLWSQFI